MELLCEIDWAIVINSIIAIAAVFALFFSILTYRNNRALIVKQQFESTFFNMMEQLEDIVSKLTIDVIRESISIKTNTKGFEHMRRITDTELVTIIGRDVFEGYFNKSQITIIDKEELREIYQLANNTDENRFLIQNLEIELALRNDNDTVSDIIIGKGVREIIDVIGIKGYENIDNIHILDHYFRYLYRIMKFVDKAVYLESKKKSIEVRYNYMGILRATLSPYELVFLFYNDLSKYGNKEVKPLIEKYSMFKSLRKELLANSTKDENLEVIRDDYYNDYDRYIKTPSEEDEHIPNLIYEASAISKKDNPDLKN